MPRRTRRALALLTLAALPAALSARQPPRVLVLDDVRIVDGTGSRPIDRGRVVVQGDRIVAVGSADTVPLPAGAERVDLAGRTITPGLIDLHFHIERDPKLVLRQLSHGVTAFREPGQWEEKFAGLREMMAAEGLPGPRIFTAGPHIDGEGPAYPADSVVARDATEARWLADRSITQGASAIKIYFRLPLASALAVIDVCKARGVPSTAHLEILDARPLLEAGLNGIEHITSLGTSLLPRVKAEAYRQAVLADNNARRDGRYKMFAEADLDGPEARALYEVIGRHRPWIDATLAVFEQRQGQMPRGTKPDVARQRVSGFAKMMQLTRRVAGEGGRVVMGGHSVVPFAGRGEAPWREIELLVESGLTPLEAITAATGTAAAFLYKDREFGTLGPGLLADIAVFRDDPSASIGAIRSVERVMVGGRWIEVGRYRKF
jgi:imidazolonepropionase-like amidohydrolase